MLPLQHCPLPPETSQLLGSDHLSGHFSVCFTSLGFGTWPFFWDSSGFDQVSVLSIFSLAQAILYLCHRFNSLYLLKTLQFSWDCLSNFLSPLGYCDVTKRAQHMVSQIRSKLISLSHYSPEFVGILGRAGGSVSWNCPGKALSFLYLVTSPSRLLSSSIGWNRFQKNCLPACIKGEEEAEGN